MRITLKVTEPAASDTVNAEDDKETPVGIGSCCRDKRALHDVELAADGRGYVAHGAYRQPVHAPANESCGDPLERQCHAPNRNEFRQVVSRDGYRAGGVRGGREERPVEHGVYDHRAEIDRSAKLAEQCAGGRIERLPLTRVEKPVFELYRCAAMFTRRTEAAPSMPT